MERNAVISLYKGKRGVNYHEQRWEARASRSQAVRRSYFEGFTGPDDLVLDFGCGTGEMVSGLAAAARWGVEINEAAVQEARTRLDHVVSSTAEIGDRSVDRIVSFHAIEHVEHPLGLLVELRRILRSSGRARLIVPYESVIKSAHRRWRTDDPDMHLFAWTPLTFGNLLSAAGFRVENVRLSHWAGAGAIGRLLAPIGLEGAIRWLRAWRIGNLQLVADVSRP
jgi:SAM-dependent methyltransferase